ncbi:serine/threonine-protein kinase [Streptomyces spiramyceticus]|uniref:serine/threonine-protein kinase n=1 Tax=Streptomyces spiramyceticus TaxID=299717 RepID=UPI00237ADAF7|nr:serine/threonine-protein kinase [Streptomyces spiramyceticus]
MAERAEYRIVSLIGEGGTGRVHLARTAAGRLVALKTVHEDLASAPRFRERFRREAAAALRIGGPFTATVTDAGPEDQHPWLAAEFCVGPTIVETISTAGPLGPDDLGTFGSALAVAMSAIHGAGPACLDLKPAHVLITRRGPKIIDFGTAGRSAGRASEFLGFLAPEQLTPGAPTGPPADVFALGALLVLSSTGRNPFGSGSAQQVAHRTLHDAPDLIGVPGPQWTGFLAACLATDPAARPSMPEALAWCAERAAPVPWWEQEPVSELIREHENDVAELLAVVSGDAATGQ